MRVGLIARADSTGLGIQSKEFFDHIPCKALVIDSSKLGRGEVLKPEFRNYPGQQVLQLQPGFDNYGWMPNSVIEWLLNDIDILFCMETPYDYRIFEEARRRGVKSILQFNYEFLEYPSELPEPDLFASPSQWNFEQVPEPKFFLPVPVNTEKFKPNRTKGSFLHIAGRPAQHDRNGTETLMKALMLVKSEIQVVIRSQGHINAPKMPPNVCIRVENSNTPHYADNYRGGVLIMPRRYGGLCLPINEAIACEMPVIVTDISPNNTWLPKEWLVPAQKIHSFFCRKPVDVYQADIQALANKIDLFCDDTFFGNAVQKAKNLKNQISWDNLKPLYYQLFESVQIRADQLTKVYQKPSLKPKREFYRDRKERLKHDRRRVR